MTINTIVWGAALVVVKPSLEVTTPLRFLFYRHILAGLLILPLFWHFRAWWPKIKPLLWKIISLEMLGSTIALSLLYEGLKRTTALEASLLITTLPLFITVGGVVLLKEKQERHEWLGLIIAFLATLYLTVYPLLTNGNVSGISLMGNLLIIGSNVATMLYFPLAKRTYAKLPKLLVTSISFWVAALSFMVLSWVESPNLGMNLIRSDFTSPAVIIAVVYMAIFGSIIGLTAYIKGQDGIESSEAGLFYYLQPLVYLPLALVLLSETPSLGQILALIVILAGVVIAEKRRH